MEKTLLNNIFTAFAVNVVPIVTGILQFAVGNTTTAITTLAAGIGGMVSYLIKPPEQIKSKTVTNGTLFSFVVISAGIALLITFIYYVWSRSL